MLSDLSVGFSNTWDFLERRIEDAIKAAAFKDQVFFEILSERKVTEVATTITNGTISFISSGFQFLSKNLSKQDKL